MFWMLQCNVFQNYLDKTLGTIRNIIRKLTNNTMLMHFFLFMPSASIHAYLYCFYVVLMFCIPNFTWVLQNGAFCIKNQSILIYLYIVVLSDWFGKLKKIIYVKKNCDIKNGLADIYWAYKKKFLQKKNFKISGFWVHPLKLFRKAENK